MKVIRARNIMQMWQVYLVSPGKVLKQKGKPEATFGNQLLKFCHAKALQYHRLCKNV